VLYCCLDLLHAGTQYNDLNTRAGVMDPAKIRFCRMRISFTISAQMQMWMHFCQAIRITS